MIWGVTLRSVMGKVFSQVVNTRLVSCCGRLHHLYARQTGLQVDRCYV